MRYPRIRRSDYGNLHQLRDTDPPPKNGAPRRGCAFGFGGEADGPNGGIPPLVEEYERKGTSEGAPV